MKTPGVNFPVSIERIRTSTEFAAALTSAEIGTLRALSSRSLGSVVTNCRSSWVRRHAIDAFTFFAKTYDYPSGKDRWRGIGRTTALAASRAERECRAYAWLAAEGFSCPRVLAWGEHRQRGFLRRALIVTEAWPGKRVDSYLQELPRAEGETLLYAVIDFVERLHRRGFRDRNLDLRNILARPCGDNWELCKVDSPRFRLVKHTRLDDPLATADWQRLQTSCAEAGHRLPSPQN